MRQILCVLMLLLLLSACGQNSGRDAPEAEKNASETPSADVRMEEARKSFMEAAQGGDVEKVKQSLAGGVEVNSRDWKKRTALHWAAENGSTEMVKLLLAEGADVNALGDYDRTALHKAINFQPKNMDVIKLLIDAGASVNAADRGGDRPLHYACLRRAANVADLLISRGADVKARNTEYGSTALHSAVSLVNVELVDLLLAAGAEVNARRKDGTTPLHVAVERSSMRMVRLLLDKGADIRMQDNEGRSVLHLGIMGEFKTPPHELIALLIAEGADVNAATSEGATPLHCAAAAGSSSVAELLLGNGPFVNPKDARGLTPADWAVNFNRKAEIVEFLRAKGGVLAERRLMFACDQNDIAAAKEAIAGGADLNARDIWKNTTLHRAVQRGYINVVELLLAEGAEVNCLGLNRKTPLDFAKGEEMRNLLRSRGAVSGKDLKESKEE